jgi:hypothetical protein
VFKKAGTVTGLYREDYGYIPNAACFTVYRDVWREVVSRLTTLSSMTDDSYASRIVGKKKDKD